VFTDRVLAGRLYVPDHLEADAPLDRIFVRDLVLMANIGVHDHEHGAPQRVRLNVEVEVRREVEAFTDDIAQVISYEDIVVGIKALIAEGHIQLVETLAEKIADLSLRDSRAVRARVRVEKLDVIPEAEAVGAEIVRRRPVPPPLNVYRLDVARERMAPKPVDAGE